MKIPRAETRRYAVAPYFDTFLEDAPFWHIERTLSRTVFLVTEYSAKHSS